MSTMDGQAMVESVVMVVVKNNFVTYLTRKKSEYFIGKLLPLEI